MLALLAHCYALYGQIEIVAGSVTCEQSIRQVTDNTIPIGQFILCPTPSFLPGIFHQGSPEAKAVAEETETPG